MTQTQIPFYTHAEDYLASPTPEIQLLRGELIINRCTLRIDKLHFKGGGGGGASAHRKKSFWNDKTKL